MKIGTSRNLYIILALDFVLLCASFYLAHLIRFEFRVPEWSLVKFYALLPFVLLVKAWCFYLFNLYKGMWRYTSLNDLLNVVKASTLGSLVLIVTILYVNRFEQVSRSVFIIDWCLTINFIASLRIVTRLTFGQFTENITMQNLKEVLLSWVKIKLNTGPRVIIIGAGDCGEKICREIREHASLKYHIVGFVDDDLSKIGRQIHGMSVLGRIDDLKETVVTTGVQEAIIAIPSLGVERMRQIVDLCKEAEIKFKTVPSMSELINGKVTVDLLRDVEYRDFLGREPVNLDKERICSQLEGKKVLVTGGGGSIGRELCKQICRFKPYQIILFEKAETPLYEIDIELKKEFPAVRVLPVLGDIQEEDEVIAVFKENRPDIVFHAAAYKHVPMLEQYPWKAVKNNIIGTENLVKTAVRYESEKFVLVSTDKAVNPANVMGATKRIAEMLVQYAGLKNKAKTNFITVRFGNVIGSGGSVIPLFKSQIKQGGPVTVTHPGMYRYFMLIPEACQLILQAGTIGKGGGIYVLDMGDPVNIREMAMDLIRFFRYEPEKDIKIKYIGLRPGEKLNEEIVGKHETVSPTSHPKIMILNSGEFDFDEFNALLNELKQVSLKCQDAVLVQCALKKIVPEYTLEGFQLSG